jgi:protein phosphatase PTC7
MILLCSVCALLRFLVRSLECAVRCSDIGQSEYASDPQLSEDAHFVTRVKLPDEKTNTLRSLTYMGVADGVGSWREYDVDPREFSHRLMQECENILQEACHDNRATSVEGQKFRRVISPAEVMAQAYERVKADNIIGSTTACIALFDGHRHQLHFSNLGDSGLIVMRHIDSDVAGALRREKQTPRAERTSDLRLAFVSQQQLRSFNHPFQLGWTGEEIPEGEKSSFKAARDACTSSVHVRRGDLIVLATDGLFDNVDAEEICSICLDWEQRNGFIRFGDVVARERRWSMGNSLTQISAERIDDLAQALCQRARENSLNTELDSPFAILAKENDIMWSGGMPDDCTCRK